jgi:hypothetical protein
MCRECISSNAWQVQALPGMPADYLVVLVDTSTFAAQGCHNDESEELWHEQLE